MFKEFDYDKYYPEIDRVANEIIFLLNEYNLPKGLITNIIERVNAAVEKAALNCKLNIDGVH